MSELTDEDLCFLEIQNEYAKYSEHASLANQDCGDDEDKDFEDLEKYFCQFSEVLCPPVQPASSRVFGTNLINRACSTSACDIICRQPRQHAYTSSSNTSLSPSVSEFSDANDDRSVETDEHCPGKLAIVRGKPERVPHATPRRVRVFKKKNRDLEPSQISLALTPCCPQACHLRFNYLDIEKERTHFYSMKQTEQSDWLARELSFWGAPNLETEVFEFKYQVQGKQCCALFLEQALCICHQRLTDMRKRVLSKGFEDSKKEPMMENRALQDGVEFYIREYARSQSGGLPTLNMKTELPAGTTKEKVYVEYLTDFGEDWKTKTASLSCWYKVWNQRCGTIKANNSANRFTKCGKCTNIKTLRKLAGTEAKGTYF
jgi:hypothetical protein